jgi:hypothetical protein
MSTEPNKKFLGVLLVIYWAAVGYFPFVPISYWRGYRAAIGCPQDGDCYVPGSEHLLGLELMITTAAILFWPLASIKLFAAVRMIFTNR